MSNKYAIFSKTALLRNQKSFKKLHFSEKQQSEIKAPEINIFKRWKLQNTDLFTMYLFIYLIICFNFSLILHFIHLVYFLCFSLINILQITAKMFACCRRGNIPNLILFMLHLCRTMILINVIYIDASFNQLMALLIKFSFYYKILQIFSLCQWSFFSL